MSRQYTTQIFNFSAKQHLMSNRNKWTTYLRLGWMTAHVSKGVCVKTATDKVNLFRIWFINFEFFRLFLVCQTQIKTDFDFMIFTFYLLELLSFILKGSTYSKYLVGDGAKI